MSERKPRRDKGTRRSGWVPLVCSGCGARFERRKTEVRDQAFVFCKRSCYNASGAFRAGARGGRPRSDEWANWTPETAQRETLQAVLLYGSPSGQLMSDGYKMFLWPEHPASPQNGRIGEHRVVAYEHVGDGITGHHVDHHNGDRSDNRWENLKVRTPSDHMARTSRDQGSGFAYGFVRWAKEHRPEVLEEYRATIMGG